MQWYGVPAVSNMEMTLGGLLYTGAICNLKPACSVRIRCMCRTRSHGVSRMDEHSQK